MAISRDLETSLIEKNMFKCFDGDSTEVVKVLSILQKAQDLHCKKINDELANTKKTYEISHRADNKEVGLLNK